MSEDKEIQKAVGHYLEKVAAELTNVSPDEKDSILQGVESHIYEALEKRSSGAPTAADLDFVLAEMAPPHSYAQAGGIPSPETGPAPGAKVPRSAIIGAILVPFVFLMMLLVAPLVNASWAAGLKLALIFVVPAAAVSTILGFNAISKIRASKGRLRGMPLAVAVAFVYPVIAFDLLFVWCAQVLGEATVWPNRGYEAFVPVAAVLALALDVLIFWAAWRWVSPKPARTAENQVPRKFCKYALIGAAFAPFGIALLILYVTNPSLIHLGYMFPIRILGVLSPVVTLVFGLMGISAIRASNGRLIGLPLSVGLVLLDMLVLLDGFIIYVMCRETTNIARQLPDGWPIALTVATATVVTLVSVTWISIWVPRALWRWASRPLAAGEFT